MKLTKLLSIENELMRTHAKLKEAIKKAHSNDTFTKWDGHNTFDSTVPEHERDCTNTKEASAFKRSAMDLKRELSNL